MYEDGGNNNTRDLPPLHAENEHEEMLKNNLMAVEYLVEMVEVEEADSHVVPAHVVHAAISLGISTEITTPGKGGHQFTIYIDTGMRATDLKGVLHTTDEVDRSHPLFQVSRIFSAGGKQK